VITGGDRKLGDCEARQRFVAGKMKIRLFMEHKAAIVGPNLVQISDYFCVSGKWDCTAQNLPGMNRMLRC
jgi:hypothetical protein